MSYTKQKVETLYYDQLVGSLPSMEGKTVVITGTTSGTGKAASRAIARLGAKLVMLNRQSERSEKAYADLKAEYPNANILSIECDLMSFDSVRKGAEEVRQQCPEGINVLCNNAGVMALKDEATLDGYDVQMQVNHLSHFLLTAKLFPLLEKAAESAGEARIVNHSSIARMSPSKTLKEKYLGQNGGGLGGNGSSMFFGGARWKRYNQTKLANCTFTAALHARLVAKGSKVKALVAHPGVSNTELQVTTAADGGMAAGFTSRFMRFGQSEEDGAMGIITAMCADNVRSGTFFGPGKSAIAIKGKVTSWPLEKFYDNQATRDLLWNTSNAAIGRSFDI